MLKTDKNTKIINLFGAPGVGKSSTAAGIFYLMKKRHHDIELVTEYAKRLVWQMHELHQLEIVAQQNNSQHILLGKVALAVTDSPLLLCSFYAGNEYPSSFHLLCEDIFNRYDNINFFITRNKDLPYMAEGRLQNREEAIEIEHQMQEFLHNSGIDFYTVPLSENTAEDIIKIVLQNQV